MSPILTSWKTSLCGFLVVACGATNYLNALPAKWQSLFNGICGIAVGLGLIAAKDANVSNAPVPAPAASVPPAVNKQS